MNARILKCFIASPSDTNEERKICDEVFEEVNSTLGDHYGFRIESIKWETDPYLDFGADGQEVLNKQLTPGAHDYFVGIMWKHFGAPTQRADSGTEEEFDLAYNAWQEDKKCNIQFYFNNKSPETLTSIDTNQLEKIRAFKEKVRTRGGLYGQYIGAEDFRKKLRHNITKSLCKRHSSRTETQLEHPSRYSLTLTEFENDLSSALQSYKSQPSVFIKPSLSESREIGSKSNLLDAIIESLEDCIITAPPQFGLTCLSLHIRIEAFKLGNFGTYINISHVKSRNVLKTIERQLQSFEKEPSDMQFLLIDEWNSSNDEHIKIAKTINNTYPQIPLLLFTNDDSPIDPRSRLSPLNKKFRMLHLQALSRNNMRQLVEQFDSDSTSREEVLSEMATHLESINVHRTPLNCLTLLRVKRSGYNEKLLNKTKLMKAILFVLFTDDESFSYSDSKPDIDECTFILGRYCKKLVKQCSRSFDILEFKTELQSICDKELISLDIEEMIRILEDNTILIKCAGKYEFKHRYWIFYFAAECMFHDADFREFILSENKYSNFPELIDFYSGIDGKRKDLIETLRTDLEKLIDEVDTNIGIDPNYNPLSTFLWDPTSESIEETRKEIAEKVESSNLPPEIKDKHADKHYDSEAPYNQNISNFLDEYSVLRLLGSIAASSRALRNSSFIGADLKIKMAKAITKGWEEISRVIFWMTPLLAQNRRADHGGLSFILAENFSDDIDKRFKQILISNPGNVIRKVKDDLSSQKIGKILYELVDQTESEIQKHFIALFVAKVRPIGWYDHLLDHLNRLHPSSYYLGSLLMTLEEEIRLGFIDDNAELKLKKLTGAVLAKRRYAAKALKKPNRMIPPHQMFCDENKLPIDKLLATYNPNGPDKFGQSKR